MISLSCFFRLLRVPSRVRQVFSSSSSSSSFLSLHFICADHASLTLSHQGSPENILSETTTTATTVTAKALPTIIITIIMSTSLRMGRRETLALAHTHTQRTYRRQLVNNDNILYFLLYSRHRLSLHLVCALLLHHQVFFQHMASQRLPLLLLVFILTHPGLRTSMECHLRPSTLSSSTSQ